MTTLSIVVRTGLLQLPDPPFNVKCRGCSRSLAVATGLWFSTGHPGGWAWCRSCRVTWCPFGHERTEFLSDAGVASNGQPRSWVCTTADATNNCEKRFYMMRDVLRTLRTDPSGENAVRTREHIDHRLAISKLHECRWERIQIQSILACHDALLAAGSNARVRR